MFSGLLCPASLAALRALALWLLCPCLKTAPTAFAFVPAIRFSTLLSSGGLYRKRKLAKNQNVILKYDVEMNEVYRRLARHSPRAEANYEIQYSTMQYHL